MFIDVLAKDLKMNTLPTYSLTNARDARASKITNTKCKLHCNPLKSLKKSVGWIGLDPSLRKLVLLEHTAVLFDPSTLLRVRWGSRAALVIANR